MVSRRSLIFRWSSLLSIGATEPLVVPCIAHKHSGKILDVLQVLHVLRCRGRGRLVLGRGQRGHHPLERGVAGIPVDVQHFLAGLLQQALLPAQFREDIAARQKGLRLDPAAIQDLGDDLHGGRPEIPGTVQEPLPGPQALDLLVMLGSMRQVRGILAPAPELTRVLANLGLPVKEAAFALRCLQPRQRPSYGIEGGIR